MGKPLFYQILETPATSGIIGICCAIWFFIQKKNIGYSHVGLSYDTAMEGHHWRIITSAFSHISVIHLVFNMSALWSLGVIEQLGHMGLGTAYYLQYTLVLVVLSGLLVLGIYHILIQNFKFEYFRRVTAVGYSCVVFGWMTILSVRQPSSKLDLFGFLSLPISFAPFESLILTSIIVPQASFLGHLSGIIVGYAIAWGLIHGMNCYWTLTMLGWIVLVFVFSLKKSSSFDFSFLEIESVTDPSLPHVRFLPPGSSRTLHMSSLPVEGDQQLITPLNTRKILSNSVFWIMVAIFRPSFDSMKEKMLLFWSCMFGLRSLFLAENCVILLMFPQRVWKKMDLFSSMALLRVHMGGLMFISQSDVAVRS